MDFDDLEPHMNADGYRNFEPKNLTNKHVDFIEFNQAGNFIVGCSSLTGRFWKGTVFYCNAIDGAPKNAIASVECESGVTNGQFLGEKKIIVAEDSGCIKVYDIVDKRNEYFDNEKNSMSMSCVVASCQHDNTVSSLSVFPDNLHAVTGGMDKNIKVFDVETLVAQHTFRPAHRQSVMSVSVQPQTGNTSVFASCSMDGYCLMWDTRKETPAVIVMKNPDVELMAVTWHPSKQDVLVIGTVQGDISLMDVRQMVEINKFAAFDRPIHKMRFADHCTDWLAVCANNTPVKVFDTSSTPKIIYNDDRHSDFVRGLAWNPKSRQLISGSWDSKVLEHAIVSSHSME